MYTFVQECLKIHTYDKGLMNFIINKCFETVNWKIMVGRTLITLGLLITFSFTLLIKWALGSWIIIIISLSWCQRGKSEREWEEKARHKKPWMNFPPCFLSFFVSVIIIIMILINFPSLSLSLTFLFFFFFPITIIVPTTTPQTSKQHHDDHPPQLVFKNIITPIKRKKKAKSETTTHVWLLNNFNKNMNLINFCHLQRSTFPYPAPLYQPTF